MKRLDYIDYFRAISILYIVAGHTIRWGQYGTYIWDTNTYIFCGGTFLFVFISGFVFQYLLYKFDYIAYLKKKFINIILPYWFTMLPVILIFALTCNDPTNYLNDKNILFRIMSPLLWGEIISVQLWYIPMITVIFLLSPLIIKLSKHIIWWYALLIVGLSYSFLLNRETLGFNFAYLANSDSSIINWYLKFFIALGKQVIYFLPTYMLGMSVCKFLEKDAAYLKSHARKIAYICFLSWGIMYFPVVYILHLKEGQLTLSRLILTFSLLFFFIYQRNFIQSRRYLHHIGKFLAEYSFGIYFIHYYLCNLIFFHAIYRKYDGIYYQYTYRNTLTCMLHAIGDFLLVLFGSIVILIVIRKILNWLGCYNTRKFIGV